MVRTGLIGVVFLQLVMGSCCCRRWEQVDRFVGGLKCGMSTAEVSTYASRFDGTSIHKPDATNHPDLVVKHDVTNVNLWFENDKLRSVEVAWISRPMRYTTESRRDLCADVKSQ